MPKPTSSQTDRPPTGPTRTGPIQTGPTQTGPTQTGPIQAADQQSTRPRRLGEAQPDKPLPAAHSLRDQIREYLVDGIVNGRWKPGERIVERRIAVELEVSQTPVREALRELEAIRLIESAPNKGVRVRQLAAADLEEIYPVRAGLEQIAAELAAERLAEDVSALERQVAALQRADRTDDVQAQVRHTVAFHRELVRAAGNSVLLHTWESLGIEVWTALAIRWLGTRQQSYAEEHEAVVEAFRNRSPRVGELVKEHVLACAPRL